MTPPRRAPVLPADLLARIALVAGDREHGASWLARECARILAEAARPGAPARVASRLRQLHDAARRLAAARPSMAPVANTAARIWLAAAHAASLGVPAAGVLVAFRTEAERLDALWDDAAAAIGDAALPELGGTLYTLSQSATVERVLSRLVTERLAGGNPAEIIVDVSFPGFEGRATAGALAAAGWSVTLIAGAACGIFLPRAAAVVCGADSIRADGSVVNKVGTYPLALAAQAAGVPFFVLSETLKIAAPSFALSFEQMPPRELAPDPVTGVTALNPYFDRTPAEYITAIFTERGRLTLATLAAEITVATTALAALDGQ
ncbi:MAG: hypothetical protein ACHQ4H_11880 [Ktedonobacterales bacterium]